jgi:HK97 family phage portal protein
MNERGAGRPSWSLSAQNYAVAYGQAQFMSETGRAAASGWFGPLAPLTPIAPKDVAGRSFDFPSGYNIATKPRSFEPITVEDLRALADTYDLLRLVIETRKDQIERLPWSLRVKAGKTGPGEARLEELTQFFERPDREHDFAAWLRMLLEDLFVLDSPTLWKQRRRNGELYALHPLDGATIKRVIDDWGRTPQPLEQGGALVYPTAYQQILKGYPAIDYSARDIIYAPRNLRPGRVYGLSPVEQIVMTVCTALKRQTFTLTHFTEGNIPESLIGVPENWTPDQIKNFQDYWDAYFTGDLAARRRAKFVPGGVAKTFIQTKEPELKGAFDEWLARIVCYAFSVSPQAFVAQVNRATGETHKEMAEEEGLRPILNWVKRLIDRVLIEDFGERDVEFVFGQDERIDPSEQAQVLTAYVNAGIITRNEARIKLGQAPSEDAAANELSVTTGAAAVPVAATIAQNFVKFDPNQPRDERGRWTAEARATASSLAAADPQGEGEKPWVVDRNGANLDDQSAAVREASVSAAAAFAPAALALRPAAIAGLAAALEAGGLAAEAVTALAIANPVTAAALLGVGAYYAYREWRAHTDQSTLHQTKSDEKPSDPAKVPPSVGPGPFAGDSVPAGDTPRPTAEEQAQIDAIGDRSGCHSCGTMDPGTKSGRWVGDHQPPTSLNEDRRPQRYYPHCLKCSRTQGGHVTQINRR